VSKVQFQKALTKLSSDATYRKAATAKPAMITKDFKLSLHELTALRQVAIMSGANIRAVDKVRAKEYGRLPGRVRPVGLESADVDVSCCSCCCCCCGETAVASASV